MRNFSGNWFALFNWSYSFASRIRAVCAVTAAEAKRRSAREYNFNFISFDFRLDAAM
jgi:hypothetical protein